MISQSINGKSPSIKKVRRAVSEKIESFCYQVGKPTVTNTRICQKIENLYINNYIELLKTPKQLKNEEKYFEKDI